MAYVLFTYKQVVQQNVNNSEKVFIRCIGMEKVRQK